MTIAKFVYLLTLFLFSMNAKAQDCTAIFPSKSTPPKGVVLLAHGANLKPTRMDEYAKSLADAGFTVLRPGFTGHCEGDGDAFRSVTGEIWLEDAQRFYAAAKKLADKDHVPIYLIAYSFSAPIFLTQSSTLPFAKRVLLAPALEPKWWYPALMFLAWHIPESFHYKSLNMAEYRANNFAGVASSRALDTVMSNWKKEVAPKLHDKVPTLIFMDPKDELLSFKATKAFVTSKDWPWKIEEISNAESTNSSKMHHLVIDSAAMGKREWARIVARTLKFLSN